MKKKFKISFPLLSSVFEEEKEFGSALEYAFYERTTKEHLFFRLLDELLLEIGKQLAPLNAYDTQLFKNVYKELRIISKVRRESNKEFMFLKELYIGKIKNTLEQIIKQTSALKKHELYKEKFNQLNEFE